MLFIFDMGGVVTNTFEMDSLCKDLNITSKDFYMICKYKNYNIWEDFQLGYISTNDFWGTFNKIIKEIKKLSREDELRYNYQLVDSIYQYQQTWSGNTYHYAYHWSYLMNRQLYMAGIKLSMLLNNLY